MRPLLLAWLTVALMAFGLRAEALTPEQAAKIAAGDSDDRIAALNAAVAAGDAGLVPFVQAMLADEVKVAGGKAYVGGCHWAYFQNTCHNPLFGYYHLGQTDPNSVGPRDKSDPRSSLFQVRPVPHRTNPCLPATGHAAMHAAMADGSVRSLAGGIDRFTWWALVTPRGGEYVPEW